MNSAIAAKPIHMDWNPMRMFSAVLVSRGLVNLWYGRQKKLKSVSIGQVWRPDGAQPPAARA